MTALAVPSAGAVGITLVAAVLHAVWNAVAHGIADRLVGFALIGTAYTVVCAAAVLVLGLPPAGAWTYVVVSAAVHAVYVLLLWASYELGDFGQVYPVARGSAPLVVVGIETVAGRALPPTQLLGVAVISLGLLSLALDGGRPKRSSLPAVGAALATGAVIAVYTVIDAAAVATTPVAVYAAWMFLLQGPVMPAIAVALRGRSLPRQARPVAVAGLGGGVVSLAAYGLVLVAQTGGATAAIAALRESSIVVGAVLGSVFFGERFGVSRAVAAAVVAVGIVLVDL